jgi:hypothetical protein
LGNLCRLRIVHASFSTGRLGLFALLFTVALGADVLVEGPDLGIDGMHGYLLAPQLFELSARPVILSDLNV